MFGTIVTSPQNSSSAPGVGSAKPAVAPTVTKPVAKPSQAVWAREDFARVAARIVFNAELLLESASVQAGWRVLDVASGSGNAALAAARRGCRAVGVDFVPALLETGRKRADIEMLDVDFQDGDAEQLPFGEASFDAVTSIYGVMFAPNHRQAAAEIARVCKPGGTIALASWTPTGYIGEMFRMISRLLPPPPGAQPAVLWGDENHVRDLFGGAIKSITSSVRTAFFRWPSAEENVEFFKTYYGPTIKTFESVKDKAGLARAMADLNRKFDRNRLAGAQTGNAVVIAADYLESIIIRT